MKMAMALKAVSDTISCFVEMFLQFFENANFITPITFSLTFCFISKINYKNENWCYC